MKDQNPLPELQSKVSQLSKLTKDTLSENMGIKFTLLERDRLIATMPVEKRNCQPFGVLHGGASVVLAESLASVGAWLNIDETKYAAVGIEINANHIRSIKEGFVTGTASPLHRGSRTHVWEIKITDEADRLICVSRCSIAIINLS